MKWLEESKRLVIITNNYCNLQCPRCDTGCDKKYGDHPWRDEPWEVNIKDIKLLLSKISKHIPVIRLHGGETTMMDTSKLKDIINLITAYDIPLGILTNGYNIMALGEEYISKLDHIVLNGHGINENHLDEIEPQLRAINGPTIYRLNRYDYYDMDWVADNSPKTGEVCVLYGMIAGFYKGVIYPCCGPYYCNEDCKKYMGDWNVESDKFYETVQSLDNLPDEFWKDCFMHCAFNGVEQPTINIKDLTTGIPKPL